MSDCPSCAAAASAQEANRVLARVNAAKRYITECEYLGIPLLSAMHLNLNAVHADFRPPA